MPAAPDRHRSPFAWWAVAAWLALWQLAAWALRSSLLLPGPVDVVLRLAQLIPTAAFWSRVGFSLLRIAAGLALGAAVGSVAAAAGARWRRAEEFAAPAVALAKSVPVASLTVLALVWLRAENLAVFVVALVAAPIAYENTLAGLRAEPPALAEMARVLRVSPARRLRYLRMPALLGHLRAAVALSCGMAWKAGVAAEVIGIPAGSVGEAIYDAKVYFETGDLFAWTLAVVALSVLSERLLLALLDAAAPALTGAARARRRDPAAQRLSETRDPGSGAPDAPDTREATASGAWLRFSQAGKTFGRCAAVPPQTFAVAAGETVCLMAPSGFGKTTLLRMAAGLEQPSTGTVTCGENEDAKVAGQAEETPRTPCVSMVFQDDRLADQASALANARLAAPRASAAWNAAPELLAALGLEAVAHQAAGTCSGGQRRRIALARALLAPYDVLLLDEPFTGLDPATKEAVAQLICLRECGRTVVVATHDPRDAELLGARTVRLGA